MTRPMTQREIADYEFRMAQDLAQTVACPRCGAVGRTERRRADPCRNPGLGTPLRAPCHWQRDKKARGGVVAATAEAWNTHWHRIWQDAVDEGMEEQAAKYVADRETAEQFGPRPEETS